MSQFDNKEFYRGNELNQLMTIMSPGHQEEKILSPAQKKFNRLTKSVQKNISIIKTWLETHDKLRENFAQSILPLLQEINELRMQSLILLDKQYNTASLGKRQSEKLYSLIATLAKICIDADDSQEAEEIYNRYNQTSLEDVKKEELSDFKSEIEDMFGIDFGDDFDFDSEGSFWEFINAIKDKEEQKKSKSQKKSKKEKITTKQKKLIEQELSETQSIKEVFRQLTKVLHPDREMDEQEKIRKSDLMQRANISYKNKDLLSLLELQFEIEQANQSTLDGLSNEKLEVYNRLLQKKYQKTKDEIFTIKQKISMELNIPIFYDKPEQARYFLDRNRVELENQKELLRQDLEAFNEIKSLKQWLNTLKINKTKETQFDIEDVFYF